MLEERGKIQSAGGGLCNGSEQETKVIRKHSALELLEQGKSFKLVMKELVIVWLVRPWDMGVDAISLTSMEGEKLSNLTIHPS